MFLLVSVILSTGGAIQACLTAGLRGLLLGGLLARGVLLARGASLLGGSPCKGGLLARQSPCQAVSLPGGLLARGEFCYGLLLWLSGVTFWFGDLLIEGDLLVESGLLLWPSFVIFCYGLLVWPSGKAFLYGVLS